MVLDAGTGLNAVSLYVPKPLLAVLNSHKAVSIARIVVWDAEPVDDRGRARKVRVSNHWYDASVVSTVGCEGRECQRRFRAVDDKIKK